MISRGEETGTYDVHCDVCPDGATMVEAATFPIAVAAIRRLGWRVFKDGPSGWIHQCPDCQDAASDRGRRR